MKLKNNQIWQTNLALGKIGNNDVSAKLAFKLYKIKKKFEDEAIIIRQSLQGKEKNEKEIDEVFEMENEIEFEKIKASELEELKLSVQDVFCLETIIDFEED
ncbi:hypothetical protein [Anaerococcus vaginalis]|uniref:hypothetical protein n=1 Tax=Anaerococcus vaginalis TaxID=33037 RepID=UPI0028FFC0BB|nr:hypothetical protein [Anaerococcus vaginalis]MDU2375378.1 hypothetical protein [Anaerococcus vaginalis]